MTGSTVLDAAFNVVHDYPGGARSLAPRLDMHESTLGQEVAGTTRAKLGLQTAVKISVLSGDLRILNAFAAACSAMVLPLPAAIPGNVDAFRCLADTAREFGEFISSVSTAAADGRVTGNELADVRRCWGELVAQGQDVLALLQATHEAGKPKGYDHA